MIVKTLKPDIHEPKNVEADYFFRSETCALVDIAQYYE